MKPESDKDILYLPTHPMNTKLFLLRAFFSYPYFVQSIIYFVKPPNVMQPKYNSTTNQQKKEARKSSSARLNIEISVTHVITKILAMVAQKLIPTNDLLTILNSYKLTPIY